MDDATRLEMLEAVTFDPAAWPTPEQRAEAEAASRFQAFAYRLAAEAEAAAISDPESLRSQPAALLARFAEARIAAEAALLAEGHSRPVAHRAVTGRALAGMHRPDIPRLHRLAAHAGDAWPAAWSLDPESPDAGVTDAE